MLRRKYEREKVYEGEVPKAVEPVKESAPREVETKPPEAPEPEMKEVPETAPEGKAVDVTVSGPEKAEGAYTEEPVPQAENVNNQSIDNITESGIIEETEETREFNPLPAERVVPVLRKESDEWVDSLSEDEITAIKKYTFNIGDPQNDKFFSRLNAMLRGDIPQNSRLKYYSDVISNAISRFELKHDIICYRAIDFDPYSEYEVGAIFTDPQFTSTSVVKSRALKKPFKVKINVPKGSTGAYIENISRKPEQREFIIDKDSLFRVVAKSTNFIELEMIL